MTNDQRTIRVNPLSRKKVAARAVGFLQRVRPDLLETPRKFDIADWVEFDLEEATGVRFMVRDIGPAVEAVTTPIEGDVWAVIMDTYVYERMRAGDPRATFTAAHEVGHVELHIRQVEAAFVNGGVGLRRERRSLPAYEDAEWQAHSFAAELLAPTPSVVKVIGGIARNRRVEALQRTFGLSRRAAEVRLSVLTRQGVLS